MTRVACVLLLIGCALVPITSAAFIPLDLFIKPPATFCFCLALLFAVPYSRRLVGELVKNRGCQWLGAFLALALLATYLGLMADLPMLKGSSPEMAAIKAWIALAVGVATYAAWRILLPQAGMALRAEKILLAGISVSVAIAVLQWAGFPFLEGTMRWLADHVSGARNMLVPGQEGRGYGLAPEPSMLASQLALIALPILLGRLAAGGIAMAELGHFRIGRFTLPTVIAALAVVVVGLGLSRSRGGLLTGGAACAGAVAALWWCRHRDPDGLRRWRHGMLAATIAVLVMGTLAFSHGYARRTLEALTYERDLQAMATGANAQSRWGAWTAAAHTAVEQPVLGCGLGLAPWGVVRHLPSWCVASNPEVEAWLDPSPGPLPNPKNLWLRLAAETGILGLTAWILFLGWHLRRGLSGGIRLAVLTGAAAGALLIDGLTIDSFALPSQWIVLAYIASAKDPPRSSSPCAAS